MFDIFAEEQGNISIIHIRGSFYLERTEEAQDIWKKELSHSPEVIGINCSELEYVDSSGIATFFRFFDDSVKNQVKLVFFDLNPDIFKLFEMAKLNRFFTIKTKNEFDFEFMQNA